MVNKIWGEKIWLPLPFESSMVYFGILGYVVIAKKKFQKQMISFSVVVNFIFTTFHYG